MLAAGHHARVDRPHRQGGRQHGPAGRGAGRARQRQTDRAHHTAVGRPDQTAHTDSEWYLIVVRNWGLGAKPWISVQSREAVGWRNSRRVARCGV